MISRGKKKKKKFLQVLTLLKSGDVEAAQCGPAFENPTCQQLAVEHSIKWTYACRHEWINFLSSRKIQMIMMIQKRGGSWGGCEGEKVAQDT